MKAVVRVDERPTAWIQSSQAVPECQSPRLHKARTKLQRMLQGVTAPAPLRRRSWPPRGPFGA